MTDLRKPHWREIRESITGKREAVYLALLKAKDATAKELAASMGWDKCSVRPRLTELRDTYHAIPTGERRNGEHVFAALSHAEAHLLWQKENDQESTQPKLILEYCTA